MAATKTIKDIGIYFLMVFIIILILAILNYPLDYLLDYEAAVRFNTPNSSFNGYIAFFIVYRMIIIMPVTWLFVEAFNGKYKHRTDLKIFFILFSTILIAVSLPSEMTASRSTEEIKRLITYPIGGLLGYFVFTKCFYTDLKSKTGQEY